MRREQTAAVGLVVLLGLALLVWIGLTLRGRGLRDTVRIAVRVGDARGIVADADVRMQGVVVGRVEQVGLDAAGEPLLTLRIDRDAVPDDNDQIRIVAPLISFTPPYVEMTRRPGGAPVVGTPPLFRGETEPQLADLIPQVQRTLANLNELTASMTGLTRNFERLAGDPRLRAGLIGAAQNLRRMSDHFVVASANFARLSARGDGIADDLAASVAAARRAASHFDEVMGELRGISDEIEKTVAIARDTLTEFRGTGTEVRAAIADARTELRGVLDGVRTSLERLDGVLAETRSLVADPTLREDLRATAANVRETTATLSQIATDVRALTADEQLRAELRATLTGLRQATEEASAAFRRINELIGRGSQAARGVIQGFQRLGDAELGIDLTRGLSPGTNRLDINARVPWNERDWLVLGLHDATETNKFNLQLGRWIGSGWGVRYGLYASRLGIGLDLGTPFRPSVSLNLFGLDDPRWEVRGYVPLSPDLDVALGVDGLFRQNNPMIGVRLRR